jgi:hypothetical protein
VKAREPAGAILGEPAVESVKACLEQTLSVEMPFFREDLERFAPRHSSGPELVEVGETDLTAALDFKLSPNRGCKSVNVGEQPLVERRQLRILVISKGHADGVVIVPRRVNKTLRNEAIELLRDRSDPMRRGHAFQHQLDAFSQPIRSAID